VQTGQRQARRVSSPDARGFTVRLSDSFVAARRGLHEDNR
jgi:hypothetical protein